LEFHIGGRASLILDAIITMFGCGVTIMYNLFMYQFISAILSNLQVRWLPSYQLLAVITGACTLPLTLPDGLGSLQWLTVFIMAVIGALAVLLCVSLETCHGPVEPVALLPTSPRHVLRSFCLFLFSVMFHMNLYTVYGGLGPSHAWGSTAVLPRGVADLVRMRRAIRSAVVICIVMAGVVATAGAVSWRGAVHSNVVTNFVPAACPQEVMAVVVAEQMGLVLVACFCIPLNLMQTRVSLLNLLGGAAGERVRTVVARPPARHALTTALVFALSMVASVFDNAADIIGVLSGTVGTALMFVLPAFFYSKSDLDEGSPIARAFTIAALCVAAVPGLVDVALRVLQP